MTECMKCSKCGSSNGSRVVRTESCSDGVIRTRICFSCHVSFDTMETACEKFTAKAIPTLKKKIPKTVQQQQK